MEEEIVRSIFANSRGELEKQLKKITEQQHHRGYNIKIVSREENTWGLAEIFSIHYRLTRKINPTNYGLIT